VKSSRHKNLIRRIASITAIVLLIGQTIAAAHSHRISTQHELSSSGAVGIADSSCAICAAHFHSPAASTVVPVLDAPTILENLILRAVQAGPLSTFSLDRFGRAPPASV